LKHTGWLIYNKEDAERNTSYINWFIKEAALQHISLTLVLRENLTIGIMNDERKILLNHSPAHLPDFAVIRTVEPILNLYLETCGVRVFNSSVVSHMCNHKSITYHEMIKLKIPMVDTYFFKKEHVRHSPPLEYPFVMKESIGRSGKQVYFIQSNDDWNRYQHKLKTNDLIIQTCDVQLGKDLRVFVIGKKIIGAVMRENKDDFRANFNLGGTAKWYSLNKSETSLIHRIIHQYDFDLIGIDFLIDHNGFLLFNEIEDVVGSRILSATSDINLLKRYAIHIKNRLTN